MLQFRSTSMFVLYILRTVWINHKLYTVQNIVISIEYWARHCDTTALKIEIVLLELASEHCKLQMCHHVVSSGAVLDEQNAHTEATKLPSPLDFRKDSEEENRDSEKDEDTKELEAVTCECLVRSSPRLLILGSVLVHLHSRPIPKCVVSVWVHCLFPGGIICGIVSQKTTYFICAYGYFCRN